MNSIDFEAGWPRGTGVTVLTVGHGQGPLESLLKTLTARQVQTVIDVRSKPYSRAEHFSRPSLEPALTDKGFSYRWSGQLLGQRPDGAEFYDSEGYTLYEPLSQQKWFMRAIGEIEHAAERERVCLLCVEEKPEDCHRYGLLGQVLVGRGAKVLHARRDGRLESQQDVAHRLGVTQTSLFGGSEPVPWRSHVPMQAGHSATSDAVDHDW